MNSPASLVNKSLSSKWDGLSEHLLAKFYEVTKQEKDGSWMKVNDGPVVVAALTDSNLEATLNWQSQFEHSGPESSMPTLMAMLQSGAIQPVIDAAGKFGDVAAESFGVKGVKSAIAELTAKGKAAAATLEGRTGITRLNSMQVFSGMPPIKIQVTALFRAWSDPAAEVEAPVNQLMSWALPEKLSELGPLLSRAADYVAGKNMTAADVLAPSIAPAKIAMLYKGRTYMPLVIESIGVPINSPVTSEGKFAELLLPMTLCTLTAWDRGDWNRR